MPELPDILVYIEALEKRIQGAVLKRVRVASPFLLRTAVPPLSAVEGRKVVELRSAGVDILLGRQRKVNGRGRPRAVSLLPL